MPPEPITRATGERLEPSAEPAPADVERALATAERAFADWRHRRFAERAGLMRGAARLLRERKTTYARTMALEMGKPLAQGEAEAEKCAWACEYYADGAAEFLAERPHESDATRSLVRFDPLGPVLAVMPWNFPFWQGFRFAAPTLMAGNPGLLKHASNGPRTALAIQEAFREAGFPRGLVSTVLISSAAGAPLIAYPP